MKSQVLHTVWCYISGEAAGEILTLITLGSERVSGFSLKCQSSSRLSDFRRFPRPGLGLRDEETTDISGYSVFFIDKIRKRMSVRKSVPRLLRWDEWLWTSLHSSFLLKVHGGYGQWGDYTDCSATCNGGQRTRTRTCDNPAPAHRGKDCRKLGPDTEKRACNLQACPGK